MKQSEVNNIEDVFVKNYLTEKIFYIFSQLYLHIHIFFSVLHVVALRVELNRFTKLREHLQYNHLLPQSFFRIMSPHEFRQFAKNFPDASCALPLEPHLLLFCLGFNLYFFANFSDDPVYTFMLLEHLLMVTLTLALGLGLHKFSQPLEHLFDTPSVLMLKIFLGVLEKSNILSIFLKRPSLVKFSLRFKMSRLKQFFRLARLLTRAHDSELK